MARVLCAADSYPVPLRAVAAHGVGGDPGPWPDAPLDGPRWQGLVAGARAHRLTGPLLAALTSGALPATPDQREEARQQHRCPALRVLALEQWLTSSVDALAADGIASRVLKGAAVAHLDHPDPGLRTYVDVDLLVRPADVDAAVRTLARQGMHRTLAEPRPGFDRRFDKGITLRGGIGAELDLHRTFVLGPWGLRVDLEALWRDGEPFTLAGRPVTALAFVHRWIHACYHAALGDWPLRLGSLRDVAVMLPRAERVSGDVLAAARGWGVEAVVAAAVDDTVRLLGLPSDGRPLLAWAAGYAPTRQEENWLALHRTADKTFAAQALATVAALPGIPAKAAYLRALLLPDGRYTTGRHASRTARLRYALREVRRGRRAPSPGPVSER